MNVPFIDLKTQHRNLREEINEAIQAVLDRGDFALGQDVRLLEEEFAALCGTEHAVGLDSGLSALELSLRAFGVGPGDEVIVPDNSFIASAAAATFAGATPVLVDVDKTSYNIDLEKAEAAITPRTRAIVPVHLYGQPADMDGLMALAEQHDLIVVEDACQAHGASYKGRRAGSLGHAGAFSFYPTKNLGACGDAGIMTTDNAEVAEMVRGLRNVGQLEKYRHDLAPFNHRLDTMQAAILRVKLRYLEDWNAARRKNAALYNELFAGSNVMTPVEMPDTEHVYYVYVVRVKERDKLQAYLSEKGIGAGIHYPIPIHLQPFYEKDGFSSGHFPVTDELAGEILSLPMFPEMTEEQVRYVAEQVMAFDPVAMQA